MDALHGRHARELHAILDDVVNLSVAHTLGQIEVQIGNAWILIGSDCSAAVTVCAMASGAIRQEMFSSPFKRKVIVSVRVGTASLAAGNRKIAQRTSKACFQMGWSR